MLCKKLKNAILVSCNSKECQLKPKSSPMFYIAHISSILHTVCRPFFTLLTKTEIKTPENVPKLYEKMILPGSEYYHEWLNVVSLPP